MGSPTRLWRQAIFNKLVMAAQPLTNYENTPPPIPSPSEGGGWGGGEKFIFNKGKAIQYVVEGY
jgi:hypothetical protein